ncbi:MAG: geranylgeranyl diphosphate synthase type II [Syntrophaceae bacterium]|nr:MAG: geranylgeranyl diphosphate synthase type II [Syntrophaceae bacterium]
MNHEDFLQAYLKDRQNIVEEALQRYLPDEDSVPQDLHTAVRYSVFAGGKRIRPILCLAAAEACGGDMAPAIPVACALELIHTYSLIHDDLPAMDNDDFRRGKPTSHKVFSEAVAILAGDALLTEAFVLLSRAEKVRLAAERRLAVIQEIASAAGIAGMVGGQALDIRAVKIQPDFTGLTDIHRRKTGALIVAAVKSGAILAGASDEKIQALGVYGSHIGIAFQIADDILNVEGDSMRMGKKTGSDAALGKVTYPSLLGLEVARAKLAEHTEAALAGIAAFDSRALPLRVIAHYIMERKS